MLQKSLIKQMVRFVGLVLLVVSISVSPLQLGTHTIKKANAFEVIESDTVWSGEKVIDQLVAINPGVTLMIERGATIIFKENSQIFVAGLLQVEGTKKEPIIFKGETENAQYSMQVVSGGIITMENAEVYGGGNGSGAVIISENNTFFPKAYAQSVSGLMGAITVASDGEFYADEVYMHSNEIGLLVRNGVSSGSVRMNRSKIHNNGKDVQNESNVHVDLRYNWWGTAEGPQSSAIFGPVDTNYWTPIENFHDPVLIVPGINGSYEVQYSENEDPVLEIDPLLHTYADLYEAFIEHGYIEDMNLHTFPYEWQDSNVENAIFLKEKIQNIKEAIHWPKVDIVAHSMGGLLAREYIESDSYNEDVDQLITIGTPHLGAPKSYLIWEGAVWPPGLNNAITEFIFKQQAEHQGYDNLFDYIHERPVASLKELLPIYDYLQDVNNEYIHKTYPTGYPQNEFLENLNQPQNLDKLQQVEFSKIYGNKAVDDTINEIKVIAADFGEKWKHGYPHGFEIPLIGDQGIVLGEGDETVPLYSAKSEAVLSDYDISMNSNHSNLPTDAQQDVLELLTGTRPENKIERNSLEKLLAIFLYSPIDIQVIAPDGKRLGKDFDTGEIFNEIPLAYYTGYETENEFLTIPNPIEGGYRVLTQGTGEGEYTIEATYISEDKAVGKIQESLVTITGTATTHEEQEETIEIQENRSNCTQRK